MALWLFVPLLATGLLAAPPRQAVEIDRTLQHVYNTAIMASDVRQCRQLRLLPEAGAGDERILTALENRLLLLREVSRQAPTTAQPSAAAIAARRQAWTGAWPPGTDVPGLLKANGMTEQALDGWFRDDLRIAAYVDLRFGATADDARSARVADWIAELRRRANLSDRQR
ncbi:MAG TPA: hypothetical protein VFV78_02625 [Vicinamibacterales bacterium]|nr:hypothetical protein [Vicinamibacterales bacterium]